MSDTPQNFISEQLAEEFKRLPVSVQKAITHASVEDKLRTLAGKYKLHLDQWVLLENEIMLTLLGIEEPENMVSNVVSQVHVPQETAEALVVDIAHEVFDPIRAQLQLELNGATQNASGRPTITSDPALDTPATEEYKPSVTTSVADVKPTATQPSSGSYQSGVPSYERKDIADDPYREPVN